MRYKGIKGKFWHIFAEYIVARDIKRFGGCCIACGKVRKLQGGHYAPASNCGFGLLFSETNVHGECAGCNAFDSGHLIPYRCNLIARYGEGFVKELEDSYNAARYKGKTTKEWPKKVYEEKIEYYKQKITSL